MIFKLLHVLQGFYSEKFGNNFVEIIKDSNNVEKTHLNPDKVCLRIAILNISFN